MRLEELVVCPRCKGNLQAYTGDAGASPAGSDLPRYACSACGLEYPWVGGVVDFLPHGGGKKGLGQKLMESERMVEIYEGKWWRASKLFTPFMGISLDDEMALIQRIAQSGPADTVLDLACGPGLYARSFAEDSPAREVIGLDLSWPMLRYAVKKAEKLGMHNITFLHGDAHQLPLKDSSVDVVNCCGAMHIFPDIGRVLGELHRVIKPSGRYSMALAWRSPEPLNKLKAYLDERFWGIHYFRKAELKDRLEQAGFEPTVYHAKGVWMIAGAVRRP